MTMTKLGPGDCIIVLLKEKNIVGAYDQEYDEIKSFNIIASDNLGYYLFVPPHVFLKGTIEVDQFLLKKLSLDKRYLGDSIIYIGSGFVYKIKSQVDGSICSHCKDFFHQSAANQEDGSFICWSCRQNKYR